MEDVKIPSFQELFENTIIKQVIENKITEEIAVATAEKDKQIAELKTEIDKQKQLNSQVLLELAKIKQGGVANV